MAKNTTDSPSEEPKSSDVEQLVSATVASPQAQSPEGAPSPVEMPEIGQGGTEESQGQPPQQIDQASAMDMLGDVELDVKIELGRCQMQLGDVLRLRPGNVVELDKLAGDPVDVFVNERLVARGEVLVVNDNFCVRVSEIVPMDQ